MTELPEISVLQFVFLVASTCLISVFIQKLGGEKHKLLVVALSVLVVVYLDPLSAAILTAFAHIGWFVMRHDKADKRVLNWIAWSMIAALMSVKVAIAFSAPGVNEEAATNGVHFLFVLGLSYYTFRIASTLFDCARGTITSIKYVDFMLYCFFAPIFVGGPVERYRTFGRNRENVTENILAGLYRIGRAVVKKVLIADILLMFGILWFNSQLSGGENFAFTDNGLSWGTKVVLPAWLALIGFGFLSIVRAYFDLSAFTDLAIGGGRLLGYNISENFNRPFVAKNIIDFWRRWHLTIAGWAKDYIFSPLMLGTRRLALSALLTMIAMGLWHEISLRWLFWGVCHGAGLVIAGAWQRTDIWRRLQTYETVLMQKCERLEAEASQAGILIKSTKRTQKFAIDGAKVFIFSWVPWLITFIYMSIVFVAVSVPDLSSAVSLYRTALMGN